MMLICLSNRNTPVNSMLPLAPEILKQKGVYDLKKLFGVSTLDVVRANTLVAQKKKLRLTDVDVPMVGGHDGITILPLLSKTRPSVSYTDEEVEELTENKKMQGLKRWRQRLWKAQLNCQCHMLLLD